MKKILSILIVTLMLVSLFSCNTATGNGNTTSPNGTEGSDPAVTLNAFDAWVKSIEGKELNNMSVNLALKADFAEDPEETYIFVHKFTSTALLSITGNEESLSEDPTVVAGIVNFFGGTLRAIASCKDFTADGDKFKREEDIKYAVTVMEFDADITLSGVEVTFGTDSASVTVSATMKQESTALAQPLVMDVVMTFSDFGTTVIDAGSSSNSTAK